MTQNNKSLPSISLISTTYNSNIDIFKRSLKSIAIQDYPKNLIEHIVVDGGSSNGVVEFAKKNKCKVIVRNDLANEQEVRASLGIKQSKGDIYALIQTDNILTSKDWLRRIIEPLIDNPDIFCAYSAYNSYEKDMPLTTRYCALFGATDPAFYYLGKSEKIPLTQRSYKLGTLLSETKNYYKIKFDENDLPTIGDNGHFIRRAVMNKVNKDPKKYTHTDAISQLVSMGYTNFGVVKNSIIHVANPSIVNLLKRRIEVKSKYYDGRRGKRRYLVFDWNSPRDRMNLLKYIIFSFTILVPLMESIRGYIKIRDNAWFLHPIICILMAGGYGYSEIQFKIKKFFSINKQ